MGARNAIEKAGRAGRVKLVGFEPLAEVVIGIRDGAVDSAVVQDACRVGYEGVRLLSDFVKGKPVPKEPVVAARLVTRKNLPTKEVRRLLEAYGVPEAGPF